jgi:hypothetical protein
LKSEILFKYFFNHVQKLIDCILWVSIATTTLFHCPMDFLEFSMISLEMISLENVLKIRQGVRTLWSLFWSFWSSYKMYGGIKNDQIWSFWSFDPYTKYQRIKIWYFDPHTGSNLIFWSFSCKKWKSEGWYDFWICIEIYSENSGSAF